jgi:hypothetical protein
MPDFVNGQYVRTSRNIGSHLTQGTLAKMVEDVFKQGPKNDIEQAIHQHVTSKSLTHKEAAKEIKDVNFLSGGGFPGQAALTASTLAVCHKIAFSSFDIAMVALMNLEIDATASAGSKNAAWGRFTDLLGVLYPPHGYGGLIQQDADALRKLVSTNNTGLACDKAHDILLQFDACDQNLYFGFQRTNVRVSANVDMHYDIATALTSTGPAATTPRGPILMQSLNNLQTLLGLTLSNQLTELEFAGNVSIKWAMNSGLDEGGMIECV